MRRDIFDVIQPDKEDTFDRIEEEDNAIDRIKKEMETLLERIDSKERRSEKAKLSQEVKEFVKAEIAKIKPVQNVIHTKVEKSLPVQIPQPQIIEKTIKQEIIRPVETKIKEIHVVDDTRVKELQKEIEKLKGELNDLRDRPNIVVGGGTLLPNYSNQEGKTLKVVGGKLDWATAASGGTSSDQYTVSNVTTDRTLNGSSFTINELANVLGSLIQSLQGAGIIQ